MNAAGSFKVMSDRTKESAREHMPAGGASADAGARPAAWIVIPAYQPNETLSKLVAQLRAATGRGIVVVNDGSRAELAPVFDACKAVDGVVVLTHEANRGKGAALKTGLRWLQDRHPEAAGAVTADADGQHEVEDILKLCGKL